jgi:hypothetical protein
MQIDLTTTVETTMAHSDATPSPESLHDCPPIHDNLDEDRPHVGLWLAPILARGDVRELAFRVVAALLVLFTKHETSKVYAEKLTALTALFLHAHAHAHEIDALDLCRLRADRLTSRYFAERADRGWPPEHRIPYELAEQIRRACERNIDVTVVDIVSHARWLLRHLRAPHEPVDEVVREALSGLRRGDHTPYAPPPSFTPHEDMGRAIQKERGS